MARTPRPDILIYAINFAPELTGAGRYTGDLAFGLAGLGRVVEVIAAPPHYPGWYVRASYSAMRYKSEEMHGVRVTRCPLLLPKNVAGIWRLVVPLSFAVSSAPVALWRILRARPKSVVCVEPTLFVAPIALIAAKIVGARTLLHVQDLEIDAAFAVGHLKGDGLASRIAFGFERLVLSGFDEVVTISGQMAQRLRDKGVAEDRLTLVRNWVDTSKIKPLNRPSAYRQELGIADDDYVVLYSGQIGPKQALHVVFEAAQAMAGAQEPSPGRRIVFVVAGEGPLKKEFLARYVHLPNVMILDLQPEAQFNEFLNLADCHILPQHPAVKDLVLPSKLGGMLASGKQILVMADDGSELAEFLGRSCVRLIPGRADLLPATLRDISAQPSEEGEAARLAISEGLSAPGAMRIFERLLLGPAGGLGRQLGPDKRLIFRITLPTLTRTHSEALGGHCKGLSTIPNWLNAKRASPIRHSLSIRARTSMAETILRARKLWAGLTNPIYRGALRHKVGATIEHEAALGRFRFDTVVDVGANRGQFATFSRATFPGCRIISFEPLDEPASIFEAVFKGDPHVRLIRGAVAAQEANLHMNVTDHEDSSSFFDISEVQQKAFGSVVVKQTIVHCAPLTQFIGAGDLGTAALLKIDTQGYELEVLRGSVALLPAFKAIYCELSYVELYRGQPKASEVIGFLRDYGFGLTGVYNQVHLEGVALQADMLFEPMRPSLS